jgi:hypothetical protein
MPTILRESDRWLAAGLLADEWGVHTPVASIMNPVSGPGVLSDWRRRLGIRDQLANDRGIFHFGEGRLSGVQSRGVCGLDHQP